MNRVNKVTSKLSGPIVYVSLYKNSTKLLELSQFDLELPKYDSVNFKSKKVYLTYCKEIVINLLKNNGIEGYEYSEVQEFDGISKYDLKGVIESADNKIRITLDKIVDSGTISAYERVTEYKDTETDITSYYKDGKIKYATIGISYLLNNMVKIKATVQVMSGQMTNPKGYTTEQNTNMRLLNQTNIRRDLK